MKPNHKQYVLFDLDHTLRDAARRDHMIELAKATNKWDDYHLGAIYDPSCSDVVEMLECFRHCGFGVMAITAVPSVYRDITNEWLRKHPRIVFDEVLMNPRYNFEPSATLKLGIARERFGADFAQHILMIIDDHPEVVKAFQEAGVTAMQCYGRKYNA